jgi:hypothetical protein
MTATISTILTAVRSLEKIKDRLERTHRLQIEAVNEEIRNIQKLCPHMNGGMEGWEGGRYLNCPDCGYSS